MEGKRAQRIAVSGPFDSFRTYEIVSVYVWCVEELNGHVHFVQSTQSESSPKPAAPPPQDENECEKRHHSDNNSNNNNRADRNKKTTISSPSHAQIGIYACVCAEHQDRTK